MQQAIPIIVHVVALILMLLNLISMIIPISPGLTLIWVIALGYGFYAGFGTAGVILFTIITLLMIGSGFIDNILMGAGSMQHGATWVTVGISMVAGVVGTFVLPPFGGLIFALVGIFIAELIRLRNLRKAFGSFKGMAAGFGWSLMARFTIGMIMIGLWVVWAFTRYNTLV